MIARAAGAVKATEGALRRGKNTPCRSPQMRAWNGAAFAAALIVGATSLATVVHHAGETNHRGFVSSAQAQPQPIRKLIEWLRGLTMPAGIVRAEGRIEATQVDVSSRYSGEVVDVAVQEGDKVAAASGVPASHGRASSGSAARPNGRTGRRRPRCCRAVRISPAIWPAVPATRSAPERSISAPRSTAFTAPTSRRRSATTSRQAASG